MQVYRVSDLLLFKNFFLEHGTLVLRALLIGCCARRELIIVFLRGKIFMSERDREEVHAGV